MAKDDSSQSTPKVQTKQPTDGIQEVQGGAGFRKYFTMAPNLIFDLGLSPYALTLYMHLLRTAGQYGKCWKSRATLAEETNMSEGKVSQARQELEEAALIKVERPSKRKPAIVTIMDIWDENMLHFTSQKPSGQNMTPERSHNDTEEEPREEEVTTTKVVEEGPRENGQVVPLDQYVTNRLYDGMKARGIKWSRKVYGFHLGRVQEMIKDQNPTNDELEALPDQFMDTYAHKVDTDATDALNDLRRARHRDEVSERRILERERRRRELREEYSDQAPPWEAEATTDEERERKERVAARAREQNRQFEAEMERLREKGELP